MIFVKSLLFGLFVAFVVACIWIGAESVLDGRTTPRPSRFAETPIPEPSPSSDLTLTTTDEMVSMDVAVTRSYWVFGSVAGFAIAFYWMWRRLLKRRLMPRLPK